MAPVERGASGHGKTESSDGRGPSSAQPSAGDARPRKADRAPSVEAGTRGAASVSRLRSGAPLAPEGGRLRLLPSGPDLVHGSSSPRDRTIDAAHRALTPGPEPLGRGFSPARADCGYRAPLAPRLARSRENRSAKRRRPWGSSRDYAAICRSGGCANLAMACSSRTRSSTSLIARRATRSAPNSSTLNEATAVPHAIAVARIS